MDLDKIRLEINDIDKKMTTLFEKRMNLAYSVAEYKVANNMEIFDKNREDQIIKRNIANLENADYSDYLTEFYKKIMDISKSYQNKLIDKKSKLGYQGVLGAFSSIAAAKFLNNDNMKNAESIYNDGSLNAYKEFIDVFKALDNEQVDYGILPVENSSTGIISENYDYLTNFNFYITAENTVKAKQNLLGIKGAKISDIKEIFSHPQGFEQSRVFLSKYNWEQTPYYNTATSAKFVSEENNKSYGAIASVDAAKIYGLEILKENIQDNSNNYTRFIKISKKLEYDSSADKISLVLSVKHEKGSLFNILSLISKNKINMLNLQSRPIQNKPWEYLFYVDLQGNLDDDEIKKCIDEIEENTLFLRILGCYRREVF